MCLNRFVDFLKMLFSIGFVMVFVVAALTQFSFLLLRFAHNFGVVCLSIDLGIFVG